MAADVKFEIILYWSKEDQAFIAEVPELPGCAADGGTYQEAVTNAERVIREWIETRRSWPPDIVSPRTADVCLTTGGGQTRLTRSPPPGAGGASAWAGYCGRTREAHKPRARAKDGRLLRLASGLWPGRRNPSRPRWYSPAGQGLSGVVEGECGI